jgi:uncharacterized membrane protein
MLGQKFYPVPYPKKKLLAYLALTVLVVLLHRIMVYFYSNLLFSIITGTILLVLFTLFVTKIEKKEFQKLPFIGKFIH